VILYFGSRIFECFEIYDNSDESDESDASDESDENILQLYKIGQIYYKLPIIFAS